MTWRNNIKNALMGAPYEEFPVATRMREVTSLVPVELDPPQSAMAVEENVITALRRAEVLSDVPVMSAQDPAVLAARFRDRFVVVPDTGARPQLDADARVAPRRVPPITSPD